MSRTFYLLLLFLFLQSICCIGQERSSDKNRFLNWFVNDPVSFIKDFGSTELLGTALTGLSAYSLTYLDRRNSFYFQNKLGSSKLLRKVNDTGHPYYAGAFAATVFGTSLLTNNSRFQDAAFTSFQAVFYNHLTVSALKFTFSRARPHEREGVRDFDFLGNDQTSFPSGHTSTAFALVTPWVMYYPHPATYALYALPVAVGLGRVAQGDHWLSDITVGAVVGTYWGYYLSKKHLNIRRDNISISPISLGTGGGINVKINF